MSFTVEKVMRIWNDKEGVYLEVRQNPDCPDMGIQIHTNNVKKNEDWYGKISLYLNSKSEIEAMISALVEMQNQIKE